MRTRSPALICILLCFLLPGQTVAFCASALAAGTPVTANAAMEAAETLGIDSQVKRVLALQEVIGNGGSPAQQQELLLKKSIILRRIFLASLQTRTALDTIGQDLSANYDVVQHLQRIRDLDVQLANIANFAQFGPIFTIKAGVRMDDKFKLSALLTCISAGLGISLSLLAIELAKGGKSKAAFTPNNLASFFDLAPGQEYELPAYVERYLNFRPSGTNISRKDLTLENWKKLYHLNLSDKAQLSALSSFPAGKHGDSIALINNRILLLWSLYTQVGSFDQNLLALLQSMETTSTPYVLDAESARDFAARLNPQALEAARLLKIEPQVGRLMSLRAQNVSNDEELSLEVFILEKTLSGVLQVRSTTSRFQQDLNYQADTVFSAMVASLRKSLQRDNTINFMQAGTLGAIAGLAFYEKSGKVGNEIFTVVGGLSLALSALATVQTSIDRKLDSKPNLLGQIMRPDPQSENPFPQLIWEFLNDRPAGVANGLTRRESLLSYWRNNRLFSINVDKPKNADKLACLPDVYGRRVESIKLVSQRISMLHDAQSEVQLFDVELLDLLKAIDAQPEEKG